MSWFEEKAQSPQVGPRIIPGSPGARASERLSAACGGSSEPRVLLSPTCVFRSRHSTGEPGGVTGAPPDPAPGSPPTPAGRALPGTHLLDVLLEDTQLQPLVQPDLAVLPDVLELPLVVQHLVDDVEDVVHGLGVVGGGRQGIGAAGSQGPLELVEERLPVLAHLPGQRTSGYQRAIAPDLRLHPGHAAQTRGRAHAHVHTLTHTHTITNRGSTLRAIFYKE